jgi:DNA-binding transcriptional LysR family regulator
MKWDDLKFILAVERERGLAAAAKTLDIDYSTAHRHIAKIERDLGARLFSRRRDGYHLTLQGRELAETARRIEAEIYAAERRISGADKKLSGTIRISTSEMIGYYLLPPMLSRFAQAFANVRLTVSITDRMADLQRSDTDVVIRGTNAPPAYLSGRSVLPISYAAYVRRELASRHKALHDYDWIGFASADPDAPLTRWQQALVPDLDCRYRFDSAAGLNEAALAGLGAAVIPCLIGELEPELVRISEVQLEPRFCLWILSHADLRRSPRIRTFMRFIQAEIERVTAGLPQPA